MSKLFAGALVVMAFLGVTTGTSQGQGVGTMGPVYAGYQVFETTLVVDARPLAAEILLDGRPLGSASELATRVISVEPGYHVLEVRAQGHHGYIGRFNASTQSTSNWFRVFLVPVRP
jgi:hypothetical protein